MKSLEEAAPGEIGAIRRRAIRSYATGDISQIKCDAITKKLDELEQIVFDEPDKEDE